MVKNSQKHALWIEKWDGKQPNTIIGGNAGTMINIPSSPSTND